MIVRTYKASSQAKAAIAMAVEGPPPGHVLGSQSWEQDGRSCAANGFILAAQLAALKAMLDQGLLTQEEYEAKKAELLSRM
jgi:hypothetical protein